ERCQSFVLIAIGESIVVIGAGLASGPSIGPRELAAILVAFAGSVGLWWVYFDRTAAVAEAILATHPDPGRLGRSAYHTIHPVMIGGVVAIAAGDHAIVSHPDASAGIASALMLVGGSALFLTGHALFKLTVWNIVSWSRVVAVAVLLVFIPIAAALPDLVVGAVAATIVLAVAASDPFLSRRHERSVHAARKHTQTAAKNR
ncbi:MAG TPA: low temperature requirement protein A, partial [Candidatus Dormibacteraeota bacterium]